MRAFIVEDSPVIRENLIATLEELTPVRVIGTAQDEASAVRTLVDADDPVDLAIIDIFLAKGSGIGVLKALQDAGVRVECVMLTNYASVDMRRHCLALGAARVFDKSGDIDALVEHCLERSTVFDALSGARPGAGSDVLPGATPGGAGMDR